MFLIDREILNTLKFTPLDRDFRTMKPSLEVFLYYVNATPFRRLPTSSRVAESPHLISGYISASLR